MAERRNASPGVRSLAAAGTLCAAIVACALVAAPRSCNGGLEAYALAGLVGVAALFAVPLLLRTDLGALRRVALAVLFAGIGVAVWIAALFGANVRIICRLF